MNLTRRTNIINFLATGLSKFYNLIAVIIFTPFYIEYLGIESFAIVSGAIVINAVLGMLDSGISPLIMRDIAKSNSSTCEKMRVLGSYELVYIVIFFFLWGLYAVFSELNLLVGFLDYSEKYSAMFEYSGIFILEFCFQLICRFYISALQGMGRHILANSLYMGMALLRTGLIVIILAYLPTLEAFFYWQLLVSFCCFFIFRVVVYSDEGQHINNPFRYSGLLLGRLLSLRKISLIAIISVIYSQIDRIVFFMSADLIEFPLYTVAGSFSLIITSVGLILLPLVLPMASEIDCEKKKFILLRLSHTTCWFLSAIVSVHMWISGSSLLSVFFTDPQIAHKASQYLNLLIIGGFLSSLTIALYISNIAVSRFNHHLIIISLIAVIAFPVYFLFEEALGLIGIPTAFVVLQALLTGSYVLFSFKKTSRKVSFFNFVIVPLIVISLMMIVDHLIMEFIHSFALLNSFHPYLKFCITIIPLTLIAYSAFPLVYRLGWRNNLKADILALSNQEFKL